MPSLTRFALRVSDWLHRISTTIVVVIATAVFLIFGATVLPAQSRLAEQNSGGASSPDTSFVYAPEKLYEMAEAYGAAGREAYIRARWTFDVVFPLVYVIFLATTISWTFRRGVTEDSILRRANLFPLAGAVFDMLENSAASLVMARYPARTPVVDVLAPIFTMLKWVFVGGSMILLVIGIVLVLIAAVRRRPL